MKYIFKKNLISFRRLFAKIFPYENNLDLKKYGFIFNVYSTKVNPKLNKENELNLKMKCKNFNLSYQNNNQDAKIIYNIEKNNYISQIQHLNYLEYREENNFLKKNLLNNYLKLSKYKLTSLVVSTALAGYYMGYTDFDFNLMVYTLIGTALTSSSAAALNQFLEIPYDSQMLRTKSRPLVLHNISRLHAFTFALVSGLSGISLLMLNVNYLTALLSAFNLILYAFIYTPMKRINIINTWVGSVVGAIPPLMGYTASTNSIDLAGLSLALVLYSWQFPHFNALSWNMKNDYARAGYQMMVIKNPELCVRTAFRHSCLILIYCELMATYFNLTTKTFAFDTLPLNIYLIYLSWQFRKNPNSKTSKTLFKFSLIHLPFLICLMIISKKQKEVI